MNKTDMTKNLADLKQELCSLRVNQVAGATASKLARM
jgi:ribosomal protein L29